MWRRLLAVVLCFTMGCSFVLVRGPHGRVQPGAPPHCTRSMVVPYLDVAAAGLTVGLSTASLQGSLDMGLVPSIGVAVAGLVYFASAYTGRGRVIRGRVHVQLAGPPAGTAGAEAPAAPRQRVQLDSELTAYDMTKVRAIQVDVTTEAEVVGWFGAPLTRIDLGTAGPCRTMLMWQTGTQTLVVSLKEDGTACEVSTAGGP